MQLTKMTLKDEIKYSLLDQIRAVIFEEIVVSAKTEILQDTELINSLKTDIKNQVVAALMIELNE
jgi:hypothetical protein